MHSVCVCVLLCVSVCNWFARDPELPGANQHVSSSVNSEINLYTHVVIHNQLPSCSFVFVDVVTF